MNVLNRPLRNVFEAADARQEQARKRSLCLINEHFESVFNTVAATQIVFQQPARDDHEQVLRQAHLISQQPLQEISLINNNQILVWR